MINSDNIPAELRKNGKWVVRDCKVPYDPRTNNPAKSNDINTFADFNTAYNCYVNKKYSGIGIGIFDNLYAIDLDHCITDGALSYTAELIVEEFASYTEISPSGDGLHIFGYINNFVFDKDKYYIHNQKQSIEVYIAGVTSKYVTVTGNKYNDFELSACDNSTMQKFLDSFMLREVKSDMLLSVLPPVNTDIDYLTIGLEKDEKLKRYYNGERVLSDKSESENDLGFMSKLMYWCNNDRDKALQAFISSPYTTQKDEYHRNKIQTEDYIDTLIESAMQERTAYMDNTSYKKSKAESNKTQKYTISSASDLMKKEIPPMNYLIDDILPEGITILSASPKIGKNWFVLDLGLKITSDEVFLEKNTSHTGVLYLALEDGERRLQSRIKTILNGADTPQDFYYSNDIPNIDNGFFKFIDEAVSAHNNIKLIIIDTLQKIRGKAKPNETAYQYDYREMSLLKKFADNRGISLLIVHHNRKMKDLDDPFNMLSGTNGIMGAADTIYVMIKSNREDESTNFYITGRDVEQSSMVLSFDKNTCTWKRIADLNELQEKEEVNNFIYNDIVVVIVRLLHDSKNGVWQGKAADIRNKGNELHLDMPDNQKIGYFIRKEQSKFRKYLNIYYSPQHSGNSGTIHRFQMREIT